MAEELTKKAEKRKGDKMRKGDEKNAERNAESDMQTDAKGDKGEQEQGEPRKRTSKPKRSERDEGGAGVVSFCISLAIVIALVAVASSLVLQVLRNSSTRRSPFHHLESARGRSNVGKSNATPDERIVLEVPLKDIATGGTLTFSRERKVVCDACGGSGAAEDSALRQCTQCGGRGAVMQRRQLGPGFVMNQEVRCPKCHGKGSINANPCQQCHGDGTHVINDVMRVELERGTPEKHVVTLEGRANEAVGFSAGDLHLSITTAPHRTFRRRENGQDLEMDITISLLEALDGVSRNIEHVDGHTIYWKSSKIIHPGEVIEIENEGMPVFGDPDRRGNLYLIATVKFPRSLTESEKKDAEELMGGMEFVGGEWSMGPSPEEEQKLRFV